jgi:signal transduction histidine kinase
MPADIPATILVVDDDKGLLRLIQRTLQREGFSVATAASGEEAIAWLAGNPAALLLLDLKLQDTGGEQFIGKLLAKGHKVPFMIITGQGDERVAVEMMKRGALDYVVKDADFLGLMPEKVRRAFDQLTRERRVRELEKALQETSEREQRRIGQDLHDGLGQQLTAMELICESLRSRLATADSRLEPQAKQLGQFLREAIKQTRSLAYGLTAFKVETSGLQPALAELANATSSLGRICCRFESHGPIELDSAEAATHLYRIAQEAVNNAVKHSHASEVKIDLSNVNGRFRLQISDNGHGFPKRHQSGMGLQVMHHRAAVIGAELDVESEPGRGVSVACTLRKGESAPPGRSGIAARPPR